MFSSFFCSFSGQELHIPHWTLAEIQKMMRYGRVQGLCWHLSPSCGSFPLNCWTRLLVRKAGCASLCPCNSQHIQITDTERERGREESGVDGRLDHLIDLLCVVFANMHTLVGSFSKPHLFSTSKACGGCFSLETDSSVMYGKSYSNICIELESC